MYITEFVSLLTKDKAKKYIDIVSKKIAKKLMPLAVNKEELLAASTIEEVRTPSSKIFTNKIMIPKLYSEIKVKRSDAIKILERDKDDFKFVRVNDYLAKAINDIIEKEFVYKDLSKTLPDTKDGLLFLNEIITPIEKMIWDNLSDEMKEKDPGLVRSREQQVGAKTQENLLKEPIEHISTKILGHKNFKVRQHPLGKDKFPDFEVVDSKDPNKKLIWIDSKGASPKSTEITNNKLLRMAENDPIIKDLLSIKKPGASKLIKIKEVKKILNIYNIDLDKIKTLYFTIDRKKKKSAVRQAKIQYGKFDSFRMLRSPKGKSRSFFIQGNENGRWKTIFRIEFRAGDVPTNLGEHILKRWNNV